MSIGCPTSALPPRRDMGAPSLARCIYKIDYGVGTTLAHFVRNSLKQIGRDDWIRTAFARQNSSRAPARPAVAFSLTAFAASMRLMTSKYARAAASRMLVLMPAPR